MGERDDAGLPGGIAAAIGGLRDAFAAGMEAAAAAESGAAVDVEPTHEIVIEVVLAAEVEGHPHRVDATLRYEADLGAVLGSGGSPGALADALAAIGIDAAGDEGAAVLEQLGSPRVVAVLREAEVREHVVHGDDGPVAATIPEGSTMLVTGDGDVLRCSFERAFGYLEERAEATVYAAIPSAAAMAEHVAVPVADLGAPVDFAWEEPDRDGLTVSGTVLIREL